MSGTGDLSSLTLSDAGAAVLAFIADNETIETLRLGLHSLAELDLRRGSIRQAIRHLETERPPQAVIVDVSGADNAQAVLDDLARVCPPDVQVFVVGDNTDINFYRMLVDDLGVSEYLPKPLTRDAVQRQLLHRLRPEAGSPGQPRGGQLIVLCGASGGAGATTIAAGLAMELAAVARGHVALLDLHLQAGAAALMLGGTPGAGLRMALEDGERVDSLFLERTAITVAPRLQMIAADEPIEAVPRITEAGVARLIALLQRKFNYVVVDMPMPPPQPMHPVLRAARRVVVVATPGVVSLRDARAMRGWATAAGGPNRSLLVLNRADMKGGLNPKLVEKALGAKPDLVIPELGRRMAEAVNLGIPATRHVPALRRHLLALVREVGGVAPAHGRPLLKRMLGR
jgi:pilus assembly protein CpaE